MFPETPNTLLQPQNQINQNTEMNSVTYPEFRSEQPIPTETVLPPDSVSLQDKVYTYVGTRLKYGKKKELEASQVGSMKMDQNGKPLLEDAGLAYRVQSEVIDNLIRICFALPGDINLDELEADKVEEFIDIIDKKDPLQTKKAAAKAKELN